MLIQFEKVMSQINLIIRNNMNNYDLQNLDIRYIIFDTIVDVFDISWFNFVKTSWCFSGNIFKWNALSF